MSQIGTASIDCPPIPVLSAFGGCGLYRTEYLTGAHYRALTPVVHDHECRSGEELVEGRQGVVIEPHRYRVELWVLEHPVFVRTNGGDTAQRLLPLPSLSCRQSAIRRSVTSSAPSLSARPVQSSAQRRNNWPSAVA